MARYLTKVDKAVDRMMVSLLQKPKTFSGLVAAVKTKGMTDRYVDGWISDRVLRGTVVKLAGRTPTYQLRRCVVKEEIEPTIYPAWLMPAGLPVFGDRKVYSGGLDTTSAEYLKQQEGEE